MPKHMAPWQAEKEIERVKGEILEQENDLIELLGLHDLEAKRLIELWPTAKINSYDWETAKRNLEETAKNIASTQRKIARRRGEIRGLELIAHPQKAS